jgi:hypothetical protein
VEDVVDRLDAARAVGWYRPDDTRRILRIVLPMMLPMAVGASVVGVAYTQLKAIDPMGIEASVHPPTPRGGVASPDDTFFEGSRVPTGDTYARAHGGLAPRLDGVFRGPYRRAPAPPVRDAEIPIHVWLLFALGFLLVAAGPTSIILGLGRTWKDDLYLLLRVDALIHQTRDGRHHVAWDQVARVEHDAGVVRLRMRDESSPYEIRERFAGIDPPALAARLEEVRRKASFGLLR